MHVGDGNLRVIEGGEDRRNADANVFSTLGLDDFLGVWIVAEEFLGGRRSGGDWSASFGGRSCSRCGSAFGSGSGLRSLFFFRLRFGSGLGFTASGGSGAFSFLFFRRFGFSFVSHESID